MAAQLETLLAVWLFVVGASIGSFLNVVIGRLPADESIVRPRSKCPKCQAPIAWFDNIPLVSWVVLKGKCRQCQAPISMRYFLVELGTGVLFVLALYRFGWTWPLVQGLVFISVVVPLIFIDAEHWILPFEITLPGIAAGLLLSIPNGVPALEDAALGALAGFLFFRALELVGYAAFRQEAMGAGDKFLVAVVGAFLSWKVLLGVVLLSSLQGSVFGLLRIALTGRAGPAPETVPAGAPAEPEKPEPEPTITWEFTKPGLGLGRRLLLIPWCILLQPIPDEVEGDDGEEVEWVPGPTNLPFGPWIGLSGLELLVAGPWLSTHLPFFGSSLLFGAGG